MDARQIGRNAVAGMVDQAASSLTNYAVLFAALHRLDAAGLGAFTMAYTSTLVGVTLVRALTIEPLVIRFTGTDDARRREAAADAVGSALAIGLVSAVVLIGAGLIVSGATRSVLFGLALVVPAVLVQDAWRWFLVAVGRAWVAAFNDGVCLAATVGVLGAAFALGLVTGPGGLLVCWALGLGVGAVLGSVRTGVLPRVGQALVWLRDNKDLGGRLAGEKGVASIGPQIALMLVGVLVSIEAVGEIGAALTVLAPVTTVMSSIALFAVPESVRLRGRPRALRHLAAAVSAGAVAVTATYTVAIYVSPEVVGRFLAGENWSSARALLVPAATWVALTGARQGPASALRSLERGRTLVRLAAFAAVLVLAGSCIGSLLGGASGAVWGFAVACMFALAATWWVLVRVTVGGRNLEAAAH